MKRDEIFHAIRWLNLVIALFNMYLFSIGFGYSLLGLAVLNIAVWTFTRSIKQ
jgi:hypothetical protein